MPTTSVWAVSTEGAEHDARGARVSNYISRGSQNGIVPSPIGTGQLRATATPSAQVRVAPFVGHIVNTYAGAHGEAYHCVNTSDYLVDIRATGSGGGRSDVVVWGIDDPGGTIANVEDHQFAKPFVVENVPANVTTIAQLRAAKGITYPCLWIGRVTLPASTATATNAMIDTTGRVQLGGQTHDEERTRSGDIGARTLASRTGEPFPTTGGQHLIYIPEWATRMRIRAAWLGIQYRGGVNTYGAFWLRVGSSLETKKPYFDAPVDFSGTITDDWWLIHDLDVPENLRGTTQPFHMYAMLGSSAPANSVTIQQRSQTMLEVKFRETLL